MKIQSGRIRQVGLQPNRGMSLGFCGLGQSDLSTLANPSGTGTGTAGSDPSSISQTITSVDSSVSNAFQDFINALTPAQYNALTNSGSNPPIGPTPIATSSTNWIVIAAVGFGLIMLMKVGK